MIPRALALVLALFAADARAETPLTRAASGHLTAPVRIGGGAPTAFIIDTGAESCGVSQRFARERRFLAVGGDTRDGQTGAATPAIVLAPAVEIDGQEIGALRCAVLLDRPDGALADGVIGADALARFVVTFDTRAMQLGLHGGAQHGQALVSPRARLIDAQRLPSALLTVPVRLNGAVGVAVLDTGARRSVFNTRFANAAGVDPRTLAPGSRAGKLGAFDLAGGITPEIEGRVADLPAFDTVGLGARPAMILGLDRLDGLRLVIDYPRRRIWFDPG